MSLNPASYRYYMHNYRYNPLLLTGENSIQYIICLGEEYLINWVDYPNIATMVHTFLVNISEAITTTVHLPV